MAKVIAITGSEHIIVALWADIKKLKIVLYENDFANERYKNTQKKRDIFQKKRN